LNFSRVSVKVVADSISKTRRQRAVELFGKIDSKFRFVILASKRAKQLLKGAKPKVRSKSRNPIRLAQLELREGAVDYEILQSKKDDELQPEEQVLAVDAGGEDFDDAGDGVVDEGEAAGDEAEHEEDIDHLDDELPGEGGDVDKDEE
jgi:DNA-directed RNA polymerase subunit omega